MNQFADKAAAIETLVDDFFGPVISRYTRAQALADGVLVDVSKVAREAGFLFPVAMTSASWEDCVAWSDRDNDMQTYQDESGRLWDVLFMAYVNVRRHRDVRGPLRYSLLRVPRDGFATSAHRTELEIVLSSGDEGEPVLTISLPNED